MIKDTENDEVAVVAARNKRAVIGCGGADCGDGGRYGAGVRGGDAESANRERAAQTQTAMDDG